MTGDELAKAYITKAGVRRRVLDVLVEEGAWSDVVREAQELVELALKAALRLVGIDPPHWHDVGPILMEHRDAYPAWFGALIPRLAEISRRLRPEREVAFYGDADLVPTTSTGPTTPSGPGRRRTRSTTPGPAPHEGWARTAPPGRRGRGRARSRPRPGCIGGGRS